MNIVIGSEHAGAAYRSRLAAVLRERGCNVTEIAETADCSGYPAIAEQTCRAVIAAADTLGILICGTGIGMSMAAGKVPGVRAALCTDGYMAKMARQHNNANVLVFGARVIGFEDMLFCLEVFLREHYAGGRHDARLAALHRLEEKYCKAGEEV